MWTIRRLSGHVGARLTGPSVETLSDAAFAELRAALFAHGVVVLPDQHPSPEAHIALAERFGPINVNRFFKPVAGYPQIAEVRTSPTQDSVIGGTWHTDHSYDPAPAMASILVARDVPDVGGDTLFASMSAAASALSPGLRATLSQLRAVHSDQSFKGSGLGMTQDDAAYRPEVSHPVLVKHPETGADCLYVNGDFTTHFDGWSVEESQPLLRYLYEFATRPAWGCRVAWAPGTIAIWDNRLVQHFAVADYFGQSRLMHRITIDGVPLG